MGADTPFISGGVYWESAAGPRGGSNRARPDGAGFYEERTIGMSTENEGAGPGGQYGEGYGGPEYGEQEYGAEPTAQFDAFRARRADERAQQETQSGYVFPEEYAADPTAVFPPQPPGPPGPPFGGYPADPAGPGRAPAGDRRRWRSVAIFGGAVLVAAALGVGVWAAFDSGSSSPSSTAAGTSATGTPTPGATGSAGKKDKDGALTFRVTISSIGTDSFTGTVLANGENITVKLTGKTHYGTKAHPFTQADLTLGETVIVRGRRTGTDVVTAGTVAANTAAASSTATPANAA